MIRRPIILMLEPEQPEGLSTRKLFVEGGKFNVLTAHSVREALATLAAVPTVDAIVVHREVQDGSLMMLTEDAKRMHAAVRIYEIGYGERAVLPLSEAALPADDPEALLTALVRDLGDPRTRVMPSRLRHARRSS